MIHTPTRHGGFGWNPQTPDIRDHDYKGMLNEETGAIQKVDLCTTGDMPPVYDQGDLGSCTSNALASALDYLRKSQGEAFMTPSRLFIYWHERDKEGTTGEDSGAVIRDGADVLHTIGAPPEKDYPYDITKFTHKPTKKAEADAKKHEALEYQAVKQNATAIRAALIAKHPIVFGFTVYKEFESQKVADTGIVPMPTRSSQPIGGHATKIVGFDLTGPIAMYKIKNSWGVGWGQEGYFWLPCAYVESPKLASDFWVFTVTE